MTCYRNGGCGPYEMRSCTNCPASKKNYLDNHSNKEKHSNSNKSNDNTIGNSKETSISNGKDYFPEK